MKQLLEYIIQNALPEAGTEFNINQTETEDGITFTIEVPKEARGKIIGRAGTNIKAIRDVLNIMARKERKRVFLKILD
jgi:predicted RNA-binding protein YlqC (UPF0109 family)